MIRKYFPLTMAAIIALFLFIVGCNKDSVSSDDPEETVDLTLEQRTALVESVTKSGNGAPSGPHYNLNIIGVPKNKTADMTGDNGHRIFVKLWGKAKLGLTEGEDFQVIDANGTDGNGAEFQLPNPDPDGDGETWYTVWGRPLGQPGGSATMTTCGLDTATGDTICSTLGAFFVREKGHQKFTNVTDELLSLYVDLDGDGTPDTRYSIFDEALEGYFWEYDNNGLKLLQLRFYPVDETIP